MIVVIGATGNVGRPLVRALVAAGEQVTAVSRRISALDVPAGVRYHQADLVEPENLKPAVDGADELFLLTAGDLLSAGSTVGTATSPNGAATTRRAWTVGAHWSVLE